MTADSDIRESIFLSHRAALVEYATPILGSRETAEDIVQDAFLRFAPAKMAIQTREQAGHYLFRIVRNAAFDVLRRRKLELRTIADDEPYWTVPQAERTPEQNLIYRDDVRIVEEVLAGLPTETRIAVEMNRFGGFTLEEIAARLNLPLATVHRRIRSAMLLIVERVQNAER